MDTVGVQVFIAKHVKDKNVASPSLTALKNKISFKKNIGTQQRVSTRTETLSRGSSMHQDGGPYKAKPTAMHSTSSANKKVKSGLVQRTSEFFQRQWSKK
ncbi:hypothetical protein QE152_g7379 [Popillia japonica]|uniref:Uncharacterized protein n=1 Tax=Popillia japonica TaxID=7064 RepID=A0AAW1MDS2_POPJA